MTKASKSPAAPGAFALPAEGFVRIREVLAVFPVSVSIWWAGIRSGQYPKPYRIGKRAVAWRVEDIRALIDSSSTAPAEPGTAHVVHGVRVSAAERRVRKSAAEKAVADQAAAKAGGEGAPC